MRYLIILFVSFGLTSIAFTAPKRPPQFVVMSFDNCTQIDRFKELKVFLDRMEQLHKSIHFTFFVSGTNFLSDVNSSLYQGPYHKAGEAEIPFGGTKIDLQERIKLINQLYFKGNEFASHGVGHFDGSQWTLLDWQKEFITYKHLFNKINDNNKIDQQYKFAFAYNDVVGFRAPYLAVNASLYTVLKSQDYLYDASGISNPTDWPTKKNGLWQFNLVRLKIIDTTIKTISMDYNFYMAQSNAKEDHDKIHQEIYRKQMLETYLYYFYSNYHGNRAPLFIGHHFTNFQNGIYNQALLEFAERVCGLPEVHCVSFKELAIFMDKLTIDDLEAYQKGKY